MIKTILAGALAFTMMIGAAVIVHNDNSALGSVVLTANADDSFSNARMISTNETITDRLVDDSDINYYQFNTEKNGYFNIQFGKDYDDPESNGWHTVGWRVEIYNSDVELIESRFFATGNAKTESGPKIGIPKGTYYVKIRCDWYSKVDYHLNIKFKSTSTWEKELNDSFAEANLIKPNVTYTGGLIEANENDYYKINIPKTGDYILNFGKDYDGASSNGWHTKGWHFTVYDNTMTQTSYFFFATGDKKTVSNKITLNKGINYIKINPDWRSDVNYRFSIKTIPTLSSCKATIPYSSYTYRGRGIKPSVTVKDGTKKLTKGTDYTVSYKNNVNVGTATITITGKGNYTGTIKKTFKVKPLELSSSYAKVSIPYSSYTYSGSPIKPAVKVRFKDGDIISNSQYTVSYSNNVKVGTATITVKGKGTNVTGSYKKTFVVKPAKNEITSITSSKGAFRIGWKKATAGATGYQVLYSRDKTALTNAVGEVKSASAAKYVHSYSSTDLSDLSENFSKLPESGETWYVKVRSFVTKDGKASSTRYGNYSAVKSIMIK